jgi:hypothetical protein
MKTDSNYYDNTPLSSPAAVYSSDWAGRFCSLVICLLVIINGSMRDPCALEKSNGY